MLPGPMRRLIPIALAAAVSACGADPHPPAPGREPALDGSAPTPVPIAPVPIATAPNGASPIAASPAISDLAPKLLAGTATATEMDTARRTASAAVAAVIRAAVAGDVTAQGRAPAALAALGDAAVPGLTAALSHRNPRHRRIAALTLLQLGTALHERGDTDAVATALAAARADADPGVAAAAEHALLRITGDTTELDRARAAQQAAERGR